MALLRLILRWFDKVVFLPKPEETEQTAGGGGVLSIGYEVEAGDLSVDVDITDKGDVSVELLALILFQLENGTLSSFFYQALIVWAEENPERLIFNEAVGTRIGELRGSEVGERKLAVDPSAVFNFRDMKK